MCQLRQRDQVGGSKGQQHESKKFLSKVVLNLAHAFMRNILNNAVWRGLCFSMNENNITTLSLPNGKL